MAASWPWADFYSCFVFIFPMGRNRNHGHRFSAKNIFHASKDFRRSVRSGVIAGAIGSVAGAEFARKKPEFFRNAETSHTTVIKMPAKKADLIAQVTAERDQQTQRVLVRAADEAGTAVKKFGLDPKNYDLELKELPGHRLNLDIVPKPGHAMLDTNVLSSVSNILQNNLNHIGVFYKTAIDQSTKISRSSSQIPPPEKIPATKQELTAGAMLGAQAAITAALAGIVVYKGGKKVIGSRKKALRASKVIVTTSLRSIGKTTTNLSSKTVLGFSSLKTKGKNALTALKNRFVKQRPKGTSMPSVALPSQSQFGSSTRNKNKQNVGEIKKTRGPQKLWLTRQQKRRLLASRIERLGKKHGLSAEQITQAKKQTNSLDTDYRDLDKITEIIRDQTRTTPSRRIESSVTFTPATHYHFNRPVKPIELIRALQKIGFNQSPHSGHLKMQHSDGRSIQLSHHGGRDLNVVVLKQIFNHSKITREEFAKVSKELYRK